MHHHYKKFLGDLGLLLLATLSIRLFWKQTFLITLLLLTLSAIILFHTNKTEKIFFVLMGITATIIEAITIATGAWTYNSTHIYNVPLWIPLYWSIGGIVIKDIYQVIQWWVRKNKKKTA
jgi:hypothetical protein